jgi:hypothetical protein
MSWSTSYPSSVVLTFHGSKRKVLKAHIVGFELRRKPGSLGYFLHASGA